MYRSLDRTIQEISHEPFVAPVQTEAARLITPGEILHFEPDEFETVGSKGFNHCSGFLLRNNVTGVYTFSHVQPYFNELSKVLSPERDGRRVPQDVGPGDAVFIYGSRSHPQADVEPVMAAGRWGDIAVRSIRVDTGDQPFHTVFTPESGVLSVVREAPEPSVHHYQVF